MERCRLALGCLALMFMPASLSGQAVYGSIVGSVMDSSNAAIPHAKIAVLDVGKGVSYTTTTNDAGNYSQSHLIVGVYRSPRSRLRGSTPISSRTSTWMWMRTSQVNAQLHPGKVGEVGQRDRRLTTAQNRAQRHFRHGDAKGSRWNCRCFRAI